MSDSDVTPIDNSHDDRSIWPFLAAAAVIVVIVLGVVLAELISPAAENITDADRVRTAVTNFVGFRNAGTDQQKRSAVCSGFDTARSPLKGIDTKVDLGAVENIKITGDRAKADVVFTPEGKKEQRANWSLVRQNGKWLVCD
ncbi:hypothetical protein FOS14_20525 [Skermania sp. ID1734]|uniref:Rv0361 family membrane protein n=1 Tax=Skermania sp. ID1734 TaxID=2597516 RepID=UPI00117D0A41|nr:hypothetical protein [Skermania sp. ID1734]TSD94412.1 hypothetical protein FOS14_20525 [Skermania sp. ID1734]